MSIDLIGLSVLVGFYVVIFIVGVVAARKYGDTSDPNTLLESSVVANRNISGFVGIFTMTATTVGGGYINGTAESIGTSGLVWTQAPFGILIGLTMGGLIFARPMREKRYMTMLDPLYDQYGSVVVVMVYCASLCGDLFWTASILLALGTSLSVILNIGLTVAIVTSATVTVFYTMVGLMISVAYTDIVQLCLITFGLIFSVPFVLTNEKVGTISPESGDWLGEMDTEYVGQWVDLAIVMTFGTIPWQAYFQRVLSVRTSRQAQVLSIMGGLLSFVLVIPSVIIGAASKNAGLGAISAAVMSSMDSAVLASSSMFTCNIYKQILRQKASQKELLWIQRLAVFLVGAMATVISIFVPLIYWLFILAADVVFVIVFPQLICALFVKFTNTYGAIMGYIVGLVFRVGAGEPYLQIPPVIRYPFYSDKAGQGFPFRTFSMCMSLLTIIFVSLITKYLFSKHILPKSFDIFNITRVSSAGQDTPSHSQIYSPPADQFKDWDRQTKSSNISGDEEGISENHL